jgi:hypothetical protein
MNRALRDVVEATVGQRRRAGRAVDQTLVSSDRSCRSRNRYTDSENLSYLRNGWFGLGYVINGGVWLGLTTKFTPG